MQSYLSAIGIDPFFTFFVTPLFILLSIYQLASFGSMLLYRQFNLKKHLEMVASYKEEPPVDIYLPICGEEMEVVKNTWDHVQRLNYKNKTVYVLDDSKNDTELHKALAEQYGFVYMERPDKGRMKKAGNLKYTYERSMGEYIAIFDADFAPHPDFLSETLPHMQDPKVGIVQTPQYFELTEEFYKQSPSSYNAAFAEEPFYRYIQVARDRLDGTICCGSCALYRRTALEAIGGPYQIDYSEDAHTGYALTGLGYRVKYVPVLLSIGLSPDNSYSFFHQQHRWCMGSIRLMMSAFFWKAKTPWKTKLSYIIGFMFYLHHPITILFSFNLFWSLFLYNDSINQGLSLSTLPHLLFAVIYTWFLPIARLKWDYFELIMARTYAYSHAVFTGILGKTVNWVSTNAKHKTISMAYSQTTTFVKLYIAAYLVLILVGLRTGYLHVFDPGYWSFEFWIFWNLALTYMFLLNLLKTRKSMVDQYSKMTQFLVRLLPARQAIHFNRDYAYTPFRYILYIMVFGFFVIMASFNSLRHGVTKSIAKEYAEPTSIPTPAPTAAPTGSILPEAGMTTIITPFQIPAPAAATPTRTPDASPSARQKPAIAKAYGGWYWRPQLGKAQRWMGTDAAGNDIWQDETK